MSFRCLTLPHGISFCFNYFTLSLKLFCSSLRFLLEIDFHSWIFLFLCFEVFYFKANTDWLESVKHINKTTVNNFMCVFFMYKKKTTILLSARVKTILALNGNLFNAVVLFSCFAIVQWINISLKYILLSFICFCFENLKTMMIMMMLWRFFVQRCFLTLWASLVGAEE